MENNYFELDEFQNIYLEDSFVINIQETKSDITFNCDFVLLEKHKLYSIPKNDEQYCYLKGYIRLSNIYQINWIKRNENVFSNDCYDNDYGNIDIFHIDNEKYYLQGDWGEVVIYSKNIELKLFND